MKIRAAYLLFVPLFLAGCGASTYESRAGLTPLDAPVALAGSNLEDSRVKLPYDLLIQFISTPHSPEEIQKYIDNMPSDAEIERTFGNRLPEAFKKELTRGHNYARRAFTLYKSQIEAGDTTDSTGEVKKYLGYVRQCYANMQQLAPSTTPAAAAFQPPIPVTPSTPPTAAVVPPTSVTPLAVETPTPVDAASAAVSSTPVAAATSSPAASTLNATADSVASIQLYANHLSSIQDVYDGAMKIFDSQEFKNNSTLEISITKLQTALDIANRYSTIPPSCVGVNSKLIQNLSISITGLKQFQTANDTGLKANYDLATKSWREGSVGMIACLRETADILENAVRQNAR